MRLNNETNFSKPGRFTLFKWRFYSSSLSILLQLILFILTIVKWLFSPIALLFTTTIGIPFGRFAVNVPVQPNFHLIDEEDVPDQVWLQLEHMKQIFIKEGFTPGKYLKVSNVIKNQQNLTLIMMNRSKNVAVGLTSMVQFMGEKHEKIQTLCEFTTICPNGEIIDLTSATEIDPFPINNRRRIFFVTDELTLYRLFLKFIEQKLCPCPKEVLDTLASNPEKVMFEEYNSAFTNSLEKKYVFKKQDRYHLTWKGALTSAYRTMWPTSDFCVHQRNQQANEFFQDMDIDLESYDWFEVQEKNFTAPLPTRIKGLNTAIEATRSMARNFDPHAKAVGIIITNKVNDKGIDSFSILYENYTRLRNDRFHYFNAFSIEHCLSENKLELELDNDYLVSEEDWRDYELVVKTPLPDNLSDICSSKEASAIALDALNSKDSKGKYLIASLELTVINSMLNLPLDSAQEEELVWVVQAYKPDSDEDYFSVQCIINAKDHQILKIDEL